MPPRNRHAPDHVADDVAEQLGEPAAQLPPADAAVKADEAIAEREGRDLPNIPFLDASPASTTELKPKWRGWIHAGTFPVTIAAGIVLICLAEGAAAKWASAVFMLTSMLLFGNSALYHRFNWKPRMKVVLKRIDHANIFLLIAGTYTPLAVLALPPDKASCCCAWCGEARCWASASASSGSRRRGGCTCPSTWRSAGRR